MKNLLVFGFATTIGVCIAAGEVAQVTASVNVNLPGVYGQITVGGGVPVPELLMPRPVIAVPGPPAPGAVEPPPPLYLHVPPGHEKHWSKHCREYHACGRPVYFVSERWYREVYTPHRREHPEWRENHEGHDRDHDRDHGHGHGHDHGDHDRG